MRLKLLFLAILLSLAIQNLYSQEKIKADRKKLVTLEDIWVNFKFYPKSISNLESMHDGIHYTILQGNNILKFSYESGELTDTILNGNLLSADGEKIRIQDYAFNEGENMVLLTTEKKAIYRHSFAAKNFVVDLKTKELTPVANGKMQQLAMLNPKGKLVAYMRDNNLYLFNIDSKTEKQITTDGENNKIINGAPDWVYEEEFGFARGFYWSPDGKNIAYYKFDESRVKEWTITYYGDLYPELYKYKYPKAGEDNSIVSLHIYNLASQKQIEVNTGEETDQYIPRIKWTNDPKVLSFIRLNRLQNKLDLMLADASTGNSKVILHEENKYYIDITDDLTFLKDGKSFIWSSEKSGYNHIYQYSLDGKLIHQITSGNWDVVNFKGVDEDNGLIYYTSSETSPTQKTLYVISIDGKGKKKLSDQDGTNNASFSNNYKYFINYYSNANTPTYVSLHNNKGKLIRVLEDNAALVKQFEDYRISKKEFFSFTTSEGVILNGWMIKPYNFTPKRKYPVFMTIYGGPGINTVNDQWEYTSLWHQLIAQQGYIVVSVDPRGTGFRGEEFKKATYLQLGKLEAGDMIESAKYLGGLPYVDKDRIGIQGWSYGGYLSSLSLFKGADYFKMAIAVAPVTNWRYYDNIYTERFMRTPQENPEGYDSNSPINFAKNLKGKFLVIHGSGDDNVHFQNTMDLVTALNNANKQFDMHIYPNKNHSIYGGYTRLHLFTKMTDFIFENL